MIKKFFTQSLALLLLAVGAGAIAQTPTMTGAITTQNLVPAGAATSGSCVAIEVNNKGVVSVQVVGTYTGALSGQVTINESAWSTLAPAPFIPATALGTPTATIASGTTGIWEVAGIAGKQQFRVCALSAVTGTATVTLNTSPATPASLSSIIGGAGDASASNQVTGNASLASIDSKTPALGQALSAGSVPVVLTAAQLTTITPPAAITGFSTSTLQTSGGQKTQIVDGSGNVIGATSNALDVNIKSGASSGAVAQGSTTSGQTGGLIQAAVTTSAPTYTTAQTSPLSLDTSGNLRVAVSGGAGSTISGSTAHDAAGSAVNPVAIGGFASAAAPTNVSADTDIVRGWYLRSGAAAIQPTFAGVLASANSGTNDTGTQRVTIATNDTLVASLATKLDTLHTDITAANTQLPTAVGATTASASLPVVLATDATPTVAQASTTSGQKGNLIQGAVTTSSPSYTTAQTSPLSLDTSGNLRVNVVTGGAGGGNVTGGTAHDAVGTSVNPVLIGGYSSAAAPTDVSADGDVVRSWHLRNGAQAVQLTNAGVLSVSGSGTSTGALRVELPTNGTGIVGLATGSNTIGALTANQSVNVAQINGVTTLMGAGNTGTGSQRVTIATDQAAHATHGHGATGAAVPANATMVGGRSGANLVSFPVSDTTAPITMSTATTTQFIALSGSTKTYIDNLSIIAGGTTNVTLVYGTGSNCVTSPGNLTGAYPLIANAGLVLQRIVVPAGQAFCVTSSAGVQVSGHATYTQFVP